MCDNPTRSPKGVHSFSRTTWYATSSSEADSNTVLMKLPVMVSRRGSIGLNGSVNSAGWTTQPEDAAAWFIWLDVQTLGNRNYAQLH